MSRRGGKGGRRGRRYSPIGIPGLRRGDSFGSSHNHGGSGLGYILAFVVWMTLFGAAVFSSRSDHRDSEVPVEITNQVSTAANPDYQQLQIYHDGWESFSSCGRGILKRAGSAGYGNVSIVSRKLDESTYLLTVSANGYQPVFVKLTFLNRISPEPDVLSYTTFTEENYEVVTLDSQSWEHPEWEDRTLTFKTSLGEVGLVRLEKNFIAYGVIDDELKKYCLE